MLPARASAVSGPEDNPAMGWRSIRLTLDRPALLKQQLRAMIKATEGEVLRVMFPMIASVSEFDAAHRIFNLEMERHVRDGGRAPKTIKVGTMLEVPSLLWQMAGLVQRVDFISIGTNDLMQFMFAADRGNTRLANRYDALSPAVLNMIRYVVMQCAKANVDVSVCGEMAGKPLDALALLAIGCRNLSMSASGIGPVRSIIRSATLAEVEPFVLSLLSSDEPSVRERLRAFARDRGIAVS